MWAKQLFIALRLLRKCKLIHADLKPDNVLMSNKQHYIKVADLGSCIEEDDNSPTPYLVSRFYRAPEIIFGCKYTCQVDVWSAGTMLAELFTGGVLFQGKTNNDMLRRIMEVKGKPAHKLIKAGSMWQQHFTPEFAFLWTDIDKATGKETVRETSDLNAKRSVEEIFVQANSAFKSDHYFMKKVRQLADLVSKCITLDPEKRITPDEALQHPFIKEPLTKQDLEKQLREKAKLQEKQEKLAAAKQRRR